MKNNVNFRKDLIIGYLDALTNFDYGDEFNRLFASAEDYLKEIVAGSNDRELLERVRRIIAFKEKKKEITI